MVRGPQTPLCARVGVPGIVPRGGLTLTIIPIMQDPQSMTTELQQSNTSESHSLRERLRDIWLEMTMDEHRRIANPDKPDPEWMETVPQEYREELREECQKYLEDMENTAQRRGDSSGCPMTYGEYLALKHEGRLK